MARGTCTDCGRKHIAQAMILMDEAAMGYPHHADYAMGHLAEAESETRAEHPELATAIRAARMGWMHDAVEPNFDSLILLARAVAGIHDSFDPKNSKGFAVAEAPSDPD
jgi:hypothetical protein